MEKEGLSITIHITGYEMLRVNDFSSDELDSSKVSNFNFAANRLSIDDLQNKPSTRSVEKPVL